MESHSKDPNDMPQKSPLALKEEQILQFWHEKNIFKKTLDKDAPSGDFVFYDGPPFATGEPHYGHVVPGTVKDIIPRYKTMRGFRVRRRWGWDCHGLPVENLVEKELQLKSKKDIVELGIETFNKKARELVMRYADDWRKIIPRLGRWVDMEDDYKTMDSTYTESVWWAFSELYKKGLIYEGFKSMQLCPRCETTLSNFEVSQGYKEITDISVYVKFELKEESGTYLLAWTTTPWTLPGNTALAIHPTTTYVKIESNGSRYILAESRLAIVKDPYTIMGRMTAKDLVGLSYIPFFDSYINDSKLKNRENGWKVYSAEFVTTDSGTGIVHIAPAFGSDDYEVCQKHEIPFVQHVTTNGLFKPEVKEFSGQPVKPKNGKDDKDAHQKTDIEIIKYLAHTNKLFAKEKIIHSYPHCWRCDTPLLNYASSSWFVKVTNLREKLVKENSKIAWTPAEVGEKRFGDWLKNARDWAISRSRFWGAPIPVWKTNKGEVVVLGSIADIRKYSVAKNTYYTIRHGEAENNVKRVMSSHVSNPHHLTEKGRQQAKEAAIWLKDKKIDLVFASPLLRTKETSEIIARELKIDPKNIIYDEQIVEYNVGVWDGKPFDDFQKAFAHKDRFVIAPEGGETYTDLKKRMGGFIYGLEKRYTSKNILIISHDSPLFLLKAVSEGLTNSQALDLRGNKEHFNDNAKPNLLNFKPLPHTDNYEMDFHRPYIDNLDLVKDGERLTRVSEVFDCWFESGSMPFGETHYPFNKDSFNPNPGPFSKILGRTKGYPADFIAEGLDQTRGWFYSVIVLGTALFGKSPYKKVVVNGLVLAEDGQKMSKSKKNYPDIMLTVNKYGADALRYFLVSSPVVRGQDVVFSERLVDEVVKKHIGRLNNVVSFYEMYAKDVVVSTESTHPLDIWIVQRLNELGTEVTKYLEKYEIDKAARPFIDFIDDLSTWYVRRSRERFKSESAAERDASLSTTKHVLLELSKYLAPFMPFLAEDIYKRVNGDDGLESVHLELWPMVKKIDKKVLVDMAQIRHIASLGLDARTKAKINVRQPLQKLCVREKLPPSELLFGILRDEINVKEIVHDRSISEEVTLDLTLTPELKEEGQLRELIRYIQDMRKEAGLTVHDLVPLEVGEAYEHVSLVRKNLDMIKKLTNLSDIKFVSGDATPHLYNTRISRT